MDSKNVAVILGVALVGTLAGATWYVSKVERRLSSIERSGESDKPAGPQVAPSTGSTPGGEPPPPSSAPPAAGGTVVAADTFDRAWRSSEMMKRAEPECWAPAGAEVAPDAFVRYDIEVAADGKIKKAEPISVRGPAMKPELTSCLAKLVLQLRFPPSGAEQSARVQVSRR